MVLLNLTLKWALWISFPLICILGSAIYSDIDSVVDSEYSFVDEHSNVCLSPQIEMLTQDILSQEKQNAYLTQELKENLRYIVIDTKRNKLRLCQADRILREALCATGSGKELVYRWQKWRFSTPLGRFKVQKKEEGPIWIKPVWAFVEGDEPVPVLPEAFERFEAGVLGEYALHFGNGYMIHGTLYENRLGQAITHGCVRLGREDLEYLYTHTEVGTPVYIY